jgi:hypothetical protein
MQRENGLGRKTWKSGVITELIYGFFSHILDQLEGAVETFLQEQQKRILKKLSIVIVFIVGSLFLLNSLALFISDYLEKSSWVGYGVVGGVLVFLALIFRKE